MNICIDIGNSHTKAGVFDGRGRLVATGGVGELLARYPVRRAIAASVGGCVELPELGDIPCLWMGADTPTPLKNLYETPGTLGADRLAAAVEGHAMFPDRDVIVVDFGTAVTIDLVTAAGEFAGGNISPGVGMRLRALHEHTARLPLCERPGDGDVLPPLGRTTREAIVAGVMHGIVYEVEGYAARHAGAAIIFTGGGAKYFAERTKSAIFVPDMVLCGLNRILSYVV